MFYGWEDFALVKEAMNETLSRASGLEVPCGKHTLPNSFLCIEMGTGQNNQNLGTSWYLTLKIQDDNFMLIPLHSPVIENGHPSHQSSRHLKEPMI